MTKKSRLYFIGVILRKYRKKAGLTQRRLASKLGVSASYVCRVEKGKDFISINTLINFSNVLQIKPGELLDAIVDMENTHNDTHTLPQHDEEIE